MTKGGWKGWHGERWERGRDRSMMVGFDEMRRFGVYVRNGSGGGALRCRTLGEARFETRVSNFGHVDMVGGLSGGVDSCVNRALTLCQSADSDVATLM